MPWSITVGRFGGTAVKIHITFFLFLAWIAASAWATAGPRAALDSALFITLLFLCVVLHEFGHIVAARRYGIRSPEVTLLPIGGVASMPRLPGDPRQELVVALAGPAVNVVIGAALVLALGSLQPLDLQRIDDPHLSLLGRLAAANLFLAVFNLIPAFPMDGGRVLHALLAMRLGGPLATEIAAKVGQAFAIGLGFLGLFGNPLLLFIAIFVYMAAAGEAQMSASHEALKGLTVGEAMETGFTPIAIDATLGQAVDALIAAAQHEFPVVDAFRKPIGLMTREDILSAVGKHALDEPAGVAMRVGVDSVRPQAPVEQVFERLQDPKAAALFVTDPDGAIVGLLTRQALAEIVLIRSLKPDWRFDRRTSS
jgi:Zn-dependent protease/CBS domain-containing protein